MNKINFAGIALGFFLGQGVMFFVQTWYLYDGKHELISMIGIGVGFLSLAQWVSDFGGVYIAQRCLIKNDCSKLRGFILVRFGIALLISPAIFWGLKKTVSGDMLNILSFIPFVMIVGSLSFVGVYDFYKKNHIMGPVSALPWLFTALVCTYSIFFEIDDFSYFVGLGYLLGLIFLVVIQAGFIEKLCDFKIVGNTSFKGLSVHLFDAMGHVVALLSSQVYGRVIPVLLDLSLGTKASSYYLYAKSLSNIGSQLVSFARRIEYADLVKLDFVNIGFFNCIKSQKYSFAICLVVVLFVSIYVVFLKLNNMSFIGADEMYFMFSVYIQVSIIFWLFASMFGQIVLAKSSIQIFGVVQLLSALFGFLLIYISLFYLNCNVYVVVISEILMYLVQLVTYGVVLRRRNV